MRPADRLSQYRHPRTLEEAFGPHTEGLEPEAKRGLAWMFLVACLFLIALGGGAAWLVTSTIWGAMAP